MPRSNLALQKSLSVCELYGSMPWCYNAQIHQKEHYHYFTRATFYNSGSPSSYHFCFSPVSCFYCWVCWLIPIVPISVNAPAYLLSSSRRVYDACSVPLSYVGNKTLLTLLIVKNGMRLAQSSKLLTWKISRKIIETQNSCSPARSLNF